MGEIPLNRGERVQNVEITEVGSEPMPLIPLSKTDHQLEEPGLDVRGYLMLGSDGQPMGRVEEILLDADRRAIDRGLPLFHVEFAAVRYTDNAGLQQWVLVPMAVVKQIDHEQRQVTVRLPAKLACQQAYGFRAPDEISLEGEQEVYAFWEVEPRWARSGRGPRELVEKRR
ncbi:MAG TPA: hypothetical protein PLJ35_01765 [Anaerolineae bacterium]|nr:hypothetical protein [Anaerolineae bacterium]HOQ97531.1 hypothetical protein [Anaerolineae bacterium]HPL27516.1 hypothetical protein [Anaerolineae bacterium]